LARACLYSDLDDQERADAIQALTSLLDDPSPLVRRAMAEAFAGAVEAPHHIVLALAEDQPSIAAIILARSPVLSEGELIDCAAISEPEAQCAIAARPDLPSPVAAALAEVGAPTALVALALNTAAPLPDFSIRRMVERHGQVADLREALLARADLPTCVRIDLVAATARALASFVSGCNWMSDERMSRVAREATEKAAILIADTSPDRNGPRELVAHLRQAGQLTVGFVLRAILSGKVELFRAALSDLSGLPMSRVDGLTEQCDSNGFAALYRKAALPIDLLPAFRIALRAVREADWTLPQDANLSRTVIERVLTGCEAVNNGELDKLIVLLRRFESEAARDEARHAPLSSGKDVPLTLRAVPRREAEPLLLTDYEELMDRDLPPRSHDFALERLPPAMFQVDMAAIEAELMAA
jgi:uncharacterized protein (DUF2336 family)